MDRTVNRNLAAAFVTAAAMDSAAAAVADTADAADAVGSVSEFIIRNIIIIFSNLVLCSMLLFTFHPE